ncbi:hypothetical protein FIBSPDRAFT_956228 [Athelia psychrophila]|uniref:Uncharacterized protein n=1 Tax=Athelia psychrophila TaxID=1759441 RepID=A0A166H3D0_9AGAM|nr:hypothetical protein FIBSPDRAFT_956228 [Fibularhizoctonia sp. CBS 109695]
MSELLTVTPRWRELRIRRLHLFWARGAADHLIATPFTRTTTMAQLIRSAKSGSDWSDNELFAFNILIQDVDAATFFGTPQLPATTVSPIVLNNVAEPPAPAVVTKDERIFFEFLDRAKVEQKGLVFAHEAREALSL